MVRDAIMFRCKHSKVREKCLDLPDELTLEKAVKIGRTHEANLDSLKKLAKDEDPTVNVVEKTPNSESSQAFKARRREASFGRERKN